MISYDNRNLWALMFSLTGSVLFTKNVMLPAVISSVECLILLSTPELKVHAIMAGPIGRIYATILGFVIVFRTNMAFSRYFEAITHAQAMFSKWRDAFTSILVFLEASVNELQQRGNVEVVGELFQFKARVLHWFTLLAAKAAASLKGHAEDEDPIMERLSLKNRFGSRSSSSKRTTRRASAKSNYSAGRGSIVQIGELGNEASIIFGTGLQVLGSVTEQEKQQLTSCHDEVLMIAKWILTEISSMVISGKILIAPPILSRVYQELSNGMVSFSHAMKIVLVPFPFPFAQFLQLALFAFFFVCPFAVMPSLSPGEDSSDMWALKSNWMCVVVNFFVCLGFVALNEIAVELEEPFGDDANDYPIHECQWNFTWTIEDSYFIPTPLEFGGDALREYVLALDGDERRVESMANNVGAGLDSWFETEATHIQHAWENQQAKQAKAKSPAASPASTPADAGATQALSEVVAPLIPRFEELRDTIRDSVDIMRTCGEARYLDMHALQRRLRQMLADAAGPQADAQPGVALAPVNDGIRVVAQSEGVRFSMDNAADELQELISRHNEITIELRKKLAQFQEQQGCQPSSDAMDAVAPTVNDAAAPQQVGDNGGQGVTEHQKQRKRATALAMDVVTGASPDANSPASLVRAGTMM